MSRYTFHITVHARPGSTLSGPPLVRNGETYETLQLASADMAAPLTVSFETAVESLARLERMFVEPDGSFVWVSPAVETHAWQVDGVLYDRENWLQLVDLKGACPATEFDRMLAAFGWPQAPLVFQLVREGVFLDEAAFRHWACAAGKSLPSRRPLAED